MTDFGVYGFDPDDSAVGYSYGSDASHNQATADAFNQALNEAKNDPRGQSNTQGAAQPETHGTTGGSNAPQVPVLAMAGVSGAGGSTPPDKEWAARLAKDPSSLAGKSAEEIAAEFQAHGFPATEQQSTKGSGLAELVRVEKGPINLVEVHPGGASHGGAYTKVSTSEGKYKYIDPDTYVRRSPEPGTKFFNARTGEQIPEDSLPLRGQVGAKPADGANPSTSDAKGGGEPPSSVRAPAGRQAAQREARPKVLPEAPKAVLREVPKAPPGLCARPAKCWCRSVSQRAPGRSAKAFTRTAIGSAFIPAKRPRGLPVAGRGLGPAPKAVPRRVRRSAPSCRGLARPWAVSSAESWAALREDRRELGRRACVRYGEELVLTAARRHAPWLLCPRFSALCCARRKAADGIRSAHGDRAGGPGCLDRGGDCVPECRR
jgi:hypothetical protein